MRIVCSLILCLFVSVAQADNKQVTAGNQQQGLEFGFLPFMSPRSILKRFSPLREYLATQLQRDIYIESAPSFGSFVERSQNGEYDMIYTAPHFVELGIQSGHYEFIATPARRLSVRVMVRANSDIRTVEDLVGLRVAHGPKKAFLVLIGRDYLSSNGLSGDKAPEYRTYKSHNAAYHAVAAHEADAALIGTYIVDKANAEGLKEIAQSQSYPGIAVMASTKLSAQTRSDIRQVMLNMDDSPLGKRILHKIRYDSFIDVPRENYTPLKKLLRYLPEYKHLAE